MVHHRAVLGDGLQRLLPDLVRDCWVQEAQRVAEAVGEHHIVDRVPPERAGWAKLLGVGIDDGPLKNRQQLKRGTLHELCLGIPPRVHAAGSMTLSRSSFDTSICPVTSLGRSSSRIASNASDCCRRFQIIRWWGPTACSNSRSISGGGMRNSAAAKSAGFTAGYAPPVSFEMR